MYIVLVLSSCKNVTRLAPASKITTVAFFIWTRMTLHNPTKSVLIVTFRLALEWQDWQPDEASGEYVNLGKSYCTFIFAVRCSCSRYEGSRITFHSLGSEVKMNWNIGWMNSRICTQINGFYRRLKARWSRSRYPLLALLGEVGLQCSKFAYLGEVGSKIILIA